MALPSAVSGELAAPRLTSKAYISGLGTGCAGESGDCLLGEVCIFPVSAENEGSSEPTYGFGRAARGRAASQGRFSSLQVVGVGRAGPMETALRGRRHSPGGLGTEEAREGRFGLLGETVRLDRKNVCTGDKTASDTESWPLFQKATNISQ